jgi:hypothetical protein
VHAIEIGLQLLAGVLGMRTTIAPSPSLTNVRVVEDAAAPTGYKLDLGPFPGWKDVPTW